METGIRILPAGIALIVGAVVVAGLLQTRRLRKIDRLRITRYSEPDYRGIHQRFDCVWGRRGIQPLDETRLPHLGSIKVERFAFAFRPALEAPGFLWAAVTDRTARRDPERGIVLVLAVVKLITMLVPSAWLKARAPSGDRQSWVRLWAGKPTGRAPRDSAVAAGGDLWHDVLTDTPDVGPWRTRTRYLELGLRHAPPAAQHPGGDHAGSSPPAR